MVRGAPDRSGSTAPSSSQPGATRPTGPKARARATREPDAVRPSTSSQTASSQPSGSAQGLSRSAQQLVTGSAVCYHGETRIYVVLANPLSPDKVGWIAGPAKTTWPRLEAALPGGRLSGSRVRLRRVQSLAEAESLWQRQHPGVPMPEFPL